MAEMIERIARKLLEERVRIWAFVQPADPRFTWETENEAFKDQLRLEARAVIEAMREPTKAMASQGATIRPESDGYGGAWLDPEIATEVWNAMIGAATETTT